MPDSGLEIYSVNFNPKTSKFAIFDMDGTLIKTNSGKRFPLDSYDWKWLDPQIPERISGLVTAGWNIVIATNQSKFNNEVKSKIEMICASLKVDMIVMVSTGYTKYRKPMRGFMDCLLANYNVDHDDSFFVGDAMDKNIDHSNCDINFAKNAGIKFFFAHHYFKTGDDKQTKRQLAEPTKFDFSVLPKPSTPLLAEIQQYNIIILVGSPAIGKSNFSKSLTGFERFSNDDFPTKTKFDKALKEALFQNKKIVIDNTNPSKAKRTETIDKLKDSNSRRIAVVEINPGSYQRSLVEYLNYHRCYTTGKWIPDIAYNIYYKNYEDPALDNNPDVEKVFKYYLEYDKSVFTGYY
jgi:bifunctional polynucleotide phosphatase/kinase